MEKVMIKKVSCHVITYNHKDYIKQCIEGILMQKTNFDFEIIIGDDLSTDGTREIVEEYGRLYPHLIKLNLRTERGLGIPGKENFVSTFEMCKGEFITLCDGDDYWTDPLKLQKQVDFLEQNEDYVLCFHPVEILKLDGSLVEDFITKVPENYETQETLARGVNFIHTPSAVFRNVIRNLPPEFALSPIGDYFLYMLLTAHGKIKMLPNNMAVYRYGVGVHSLLETSQKHRDWIEMTTLLISAIDDFHIKSILVRKLFPKLINSPSAKSKQKVGLRDYLKLFIPPIIPILKNKIIKNK